MKFRLIFFLFLSMLFLNLYSQNSRVRVFGYVTDQNNQSIEFVNIVQKGTSNGTTSSASGYYELMMNTKDSMIVQYSFLGYETLNRSVGLDMKAVQVNVNLNAVSKELGDVVVRELRKQTSTTESLDAKNIRLMPNTNGGIEGLLSAFAGVNSSNELSSQYSVRGGSYDENIVYVNDIEVYRPLLVRAGQQEGLSFINPDMVQEVNFSAGGFEAKYGDKMSSVLDIKYKKPAAFEASTSVSLLGASAYMGSRSNKFTQIHGVRYKTSKYMLGTLDAQGEYDPNFVDYQTYLTYQFSPKWELTFLGNFSQNKYEFTPTTRTTSFGTMTDTRSFTVYFDGKESDLFRTSFGALTLNYKPRKNLKIALLASAFNTNEEETYDISGEYWLSELGVGGEIGNTLGIGTYHEHARNKLQASVLNLAHQGDWKIKSHQLQWGLSVQQEIIQDKIKEWELRDSAGYSISTLGYDDQNINLYYNLSADENLDTYRFQGFLQDTYRYHFDAGTISTILGLRANYWNYNNEKLISPRFSIGFIPNWEKDYSFRFATGLYYQAPFYKELRYTVKDEFNNNVIELNKNIKAQETVHFVLGADHYFRSWGRPFKFTTEIYYKLASRLIPYQVDNVRIRYLGTEVSTGYTSGVDFKLFGEMVPGTDSWVGLSLMNSKEDIKGDSYNTYDTDGNVTGAVYPGYISRPTEQRYSFTMFFQDYYPNNPKYKVHMKFVWADGLPFGPPDSERYLATLRTPPYRRVDIGASRLLVGGEDKVMSKSVLKYVKNIWLTVEVFNLLNIKNINSYYWVTDIYNQQYAVPNYLTSRQLNVKLILDF